MRLPQFCLLFVAIVIASLLFGGCATIEERVPPVATLAVRAKSIGQLETGRSLYLQKCASCHVAETIRDHAASEWPEIMVTMSPKAKLSPKEEQAVLAYVLAAAQ